MVQLEMTVCDVNTGEIRKSYRETIAGSENLKQALRTKYADAIYRVMTDCFKYPNPCIYLRSQDVYNAIEEKIWYDNQ